MIDKRFEFRERELFLCYRNISRVLAMTHVAAEKGKMHKRSLSEGGRKYIFVKWQSPVALLWLFNRENLNRSKLCHYAKPSGVEELLAGKYYSK